jgi:hypothetical protein
MHTVIAVYKPQNLDALITKNLWDVTCSLTLHYSSSYCPEAPETT